MGDSRWSVSDWGSYSTTVRSKSKEEVFSRRRISEDFDPMNISMRESRDSESNPNSNAIIIAFDETGSMGDIPNYFVREGLGKLVSEIYDRVPVPDPHVMIMGFGDAWTDNSPLQVTQFEADIRIAEQLSDIYLEGNGGGNQYESYNLPWYFAARRTSIDCWEKRSKKGYLFTVGDEPLSPTLEASHVRNIFGDQVEKDMSTKDVLAMANRMYDVFHVVVEEGWHYRHYPENVMSSWREVLNQRVLPLSDYTKLAECIVSAIEINEGRDAATVSSSWDGSTSMVIADAVKSLTATPSVSEGLVRF